MAGWLDTITGALSDTADIYTKVQAARPQKTTKPAPGNVVPPQFPELAQEEGQDTYSDPMKDMTFKYMAMGGAGFLVLIGLAIFAKK